MSCRMLFQALMLLHIAIAISCNQPQKSSQEVQADNTAREAPAKNQGEKDKEPGNDFVLNNLFRFQSEEEVIKAYGSNASRGIGYLPEGMGTYPVTVLFEGTANEVIISWKDTTAFRIIRRVEHSGSSSRWKTLQDVQPGTTLAKLEQLNGKPFTFYGFGWDYGGAVQWKGGKLDNSGLFVRLTLGRATPSNIEKALLGDAEFKSSDSLAKKADITVNYIALDK